MRGQLALQRYVRAIAIEGAFDWKFGTYVLDVLERLEQFSPNLATFWEFLLQELCTWSAAQTPRLMD